MFKHSYSKISWFTPICSPTISSNPILCSILLSPSYNRNLMCCNWKEHYLFKYATFVSYKFLCCSNSTWNWSSTIYLCFHFLYSFDCSILFDFPNLISWLRPTISLMIRIWTLNSCTISTNINVWAFSLVWIFSLIGLTALLRNSILVSIYVNIHRISTATSRSTWMTIN